MLLPIDAATLPIQLALDSRPLPRREFAAGLARAGLVQSDLRVLPSEPRRFDSGQLTALNALSNPLSLILLAFVDAVVGIAVLGVMLLLIDSPLDRSNWPWIRARSSGVNSPPDRRARASFSLICDSRL